MACFVFWICTACIVPRIRFYPCYSVRIFTNESVVPFVTPYLPTLRMQLTYAKPLFVLKRRFRAGRRFRKPARKSFQGASLAHIMPISLQEWKTATRWIYKKDKTIDHIIITKSLHHKTATEIMLKPVGKEVRFLFGLWRTFGASEVCDLPDGS